MPGPKNPQPNIQYDGQGFPYYDPKDGWKDYGEFQAAALNDMDRVHKIGTPSDSKAQDIPLYGRITTAVLPTAGAVAGGAIEPLGGEIAGAAGGSTIKQLLQSKYPKTFGESPSTPVGRAMDLATDTGLAALPAAAGPLAKVAGAMGSKIPMAGKAIAAGINSLPASSPTTKAIAQALMRLIQPSVKAAPSSVKTAPSSSSGQ